MFAALSLLGQLIVLAVIESANVPWTRALWLVLMSLLSMGFVWRAWDVLFARPSSMPSLFGAFDLLLMAGFTWTGIFMAFWLFDSGLFFAGLAGLSDQPMLVWGKLLFMTMLAGATTGFTTIFPSHIATEILTIVAIYNILVFVYFILPLVAVTRSRTTSKRAGV